uniref:Low-density lipoprotein receptor n=1 Tax=Riptortus pedestris TaxID=329032 RepID=R4WD86_RIPPE|nr:low-density lipoprotein receptor [Riptortus pedestris]
MILQNILVLLILSVSHAVTLLRFIPGPGINPVLRICPASMYVCADGRCIRPSWVCDGQDDCGDNSDEKNCEVPRSCTSTEYTCKDGRCIPQWWQCDGDRDCSNGDDEDSCINKSCHSSLFQCAPGMCIPGTWVCDGTADCINRKDEEGCKFKCPQDEFYCDDNNCIDRSFVCDGERDCKDGSDEKNCPPKKCNEHQFECSDHSACISKSWLCDGAFDCSDRSDEANCQGKQTTSTPLCTKDEFKCKTPATCISSSLVCNGFPECLDGSDETVDSCKNITCRPDEVLCGDRVCLPGYVICNGKNDCKDGSDEENCGTSRPSCNDDEFDCGGDTCIPLEKVCDQKADCPQREDEPPGKCNIDECKNNNGGCSQICVDTPTSFYCKCRPGFKLIDNFTCDDIDECEDPSSCSQKCTNEKGTFKCECLEGYQKDPANHRRCKAIDGETDIIFSRRHDIRILSLAKKTMRLVVNETLSSIALDYIYNTSEIFWSDGIEKKIFKGNIFNNSQRIALIDNDSTICDGLAVDWIYKHIYWSDTEKDTISVATLDGKMKKTLVNDSLDKPRAVVVSPLDGWMFWSDWGKTPRIERAGLDGSHRITIVSYDVEWPNGLALDLVKRRLYWIDAKLDMVFSANYDGSGRKIILRSTAMLIHPFSLALFEDKIYWSDWSNKAIYKADKFDGSNAQALTEEGTLSSPMVVHIYHPYKQPVGDNYCLNSKCSHFCFPAPQINKHSPKISCACPDNLSLSVDGLNCFNGEKMQHTTSTAFPVVSQPTTAEKKLLEISTSAKPTSILNATTSAPVLVNRVSEDAAAVKVDSSKERSGGYMGLIVASTLSLLVLVILALAVIYLVHRRYLRRNVGSLEFVNPVYRRNSGDYVSLQKNEQ